MRETNNFTGKSWSPEYQQKMFSDVVSQPTRLGFEKVNRAHCSKYNYKSELLALLYDIYL